MNVLVFEDREVSYLYPVTTGRPAFAALCASYRLIDWLRALSSSVAACVRPHLRATVAADYGDLSPTLDLRHRWTLLVNARMIPSAAQMTLLKSVAHRQETWRAVFGEALSAALVPTEWCAAFDGRSPPDASLTLIAEAAAKAPLWQSQWALFEYPHDYLRANELAFGENIQWRLEHGSYRTLAEGVYVAGNAALSDFVVTNTERGPIVIEDDVAIGPFCYLRGPLHIGRGARINEHAAIKDCVCLGQTTKIGGEVECSVIDSYSNKQHHGFLGHSYLGSWINLGAGTCNSDLKNTYGKVKMEYDHRHIATDLQFVGCLIGDYAKTAINTSIFTGKTIGVCSMVYGFVTTNVPSFVNYARSFGQVTESPPAVMEATQLRMFHRRNVQQRPLDIQLLHDMYELTRHERQISPERLML